MFKGLLSDNCDSMFLIIYQLTTKARYSLFQLTNTGDYEVKFRRENCLVWWMTHLQKTIIIAIVLVQDVITHNAKDLRHHASCVCQIGKQISIIRNQHTFHKH